MKKTQTTKPGKSPNGMRREYHFDYRKAKPNRFAGRAGKNRVVVILDPDIAKVFGTSEAVNKALRALIKAIPQSTK